MARKLGTRAFNALRAPIGSGDLRLAAGATWTDCRARPNPKVGPDPADPPVMSALPSMMPLVNATASEGPLSALHVRELSDARKRAGKVRRAAAVASFNGWTTGLFGAISLLSGFWSTTAFLLGVGLTVVALNELHARKGLLRFEPGAAVRLACNQLLLAGVVATYCIWSIRESMLATGAGASLTGDANTDAMLADVGVMARDITVMVYVVAIALTALLQGLTALYYLSRRRHIEAYLRSTPEWILRLNASGSLN